MKAYDTWVASVKDRASRFQTDCRCGDCPQCDASDEADHAMLVAREAYNGFERIAEASLRKAAEILEER